MPKYAEIRVFQRHVLEQSLVGPYRPYAGKGVAEQRQKTRPICTHVCTPIYTHVRAPIPTWHTGYTHPTTCTLRTAGYAGPLTSAGQRWPWGSLSEILGIEDARYRRGPYGLFKSDYRLALNRLNVYGDLSSLGENITKIGHVSLE